jgi:hypothetical protein
MSGNKSAYDQGQNEAAREWLTRLEAVDIFGLSMQQRMVLSARRDAAREAGQKAAGSADPLGEAKQAFLALSPDEGRQFVLWLANGAREGIEATSVLGPADLPGCPETGRDT